MTRDALKVNNKNIAIVGGGFLGLTLAYYLAKAGNKVTVIEKAPEFGGLASGFTFRGGKIERYYHHFFRSDKHIQELMSDLGIADQLQWLKSSSGLFVQNKLFKFSTAFDLLSFPLLTIPERLRLSAVSFFLQKTRNYKKFEKTTALAWCNKWFGKKVTSIIWQPLLQAKFGDDYQKISMSWLWARIYDRSSSRPNLLSNEYLGYPVGGYQTIVDTLVSKCKELGINLISGAELKEYKTENSKHILTWEVEAKTYREEFEVVVGALPSPIFTKIFNPPQAYQEQLNSIKYLGAVCMILSLKNQFSKYYWTSISDPSYPFLAVVEHTNFVDKKDFNNENILYVAKYLSLTDPQFKLDDEALKKLYFDYLKRINLQFNEDWVNEVKIFRAGFAQHVVGVDYQPPAYETGIKGLYFAHFCQIYPHDRGTNYAVEQAQNLFKLIN